MKWVDSLTVWRRERNISKPQGTFSEDIQEELQEYLEASTEAERIKAIGGIIVYAANELAFEGYNLDLVLKQVVKEISSLKQDPIQQEEWSHYTKDIPTGKWLKDKAQDPSTLYTADFSSCKLPIS